MKIQDATKELSRKAGQLLTDATKLRQSAERTLSELRKLQNGFRQKEEAEREEKLREEQAKAISAQSKAWTMPDDVPEREEKPAAAPKQEAPKQETPKQEAPKQAAPVQETAVKETPKQEPAANAAPRAVRTDARTAPAARPGTAARPAAPQDRRPAFQQGQRTDAPAGMAQRGPRPAP
ncbi:MAG: hypothetical protein IJ573_04775, partial [Clostridia bacterium]|nr:hypothetical protein [Clostridia bacterium]